MVLSASANGRSAGFFLCLREGTSLQQAAAAMIDDCVRERVTPPGFGHRFHTRDPRAARLFQMALELELEGEHVRLLRTGDASYWNWSVPEKFGFGL